jgi:hypothetical protein
MRIVLGIVLMAFAISGCATEDKPHRRSDTSVFDPVCAPDGSVVRIEYANQQGGYDGIKTGKEFCPWNKK